MKGNLQDATLRVLSESHISSVQSDREYNGVKYFDNKDGWCPICNAQLHYEGLEDTGLDDMEYYRWNCDKCGAQEEAWFKKVFQGHTLIKDDGDNVDLPLNENLSVKTEAVGNEASEKSIDDLIPYYVELKRAIIGKGLNVDENLNGDDMLYMRVYYGNASMNVAVYLGIPDGSYGFDVDTVGLGGDTSDEITVLPEYVSGWDYDTASPSKVVARNGEEVYTMFNKIANVKPQEVADIVEKSFSKYILEGEDM